MPACLASPSRQKEAAVKTWNTWLDFPDDPDTHGDPAFSAWVAKRLWNAYWALTRRQYDEAHEHARQCVRVSRAPRQRTRALYALAMSLAADYDFAPAVDSLDEALDLALTLDASGPCIQLSYLHGACDVGLKRFDQAKQYREVALDTLRQLARTGPTDRAFELDILHKLANHNFMLARHEECARNLKQARRLAVQSPKYKLDMANIEWNTALLSRWRGDPWSALGHAVRAAEVIMQIGSVPSQGRIQGVIADIAMDIADTFPVGTLLTGRDQYLEVAGPYALRAVALAQRAHDPLGEGMALLTQARYHRMVRRNENRMPVYKRVAQIAWRERDMSVLGQAYTAQGDELLAHQHREQATNCYRKALDVLRLTDAHVMRVFPQRALERASRTM
jgi:tetratricopeptide (TPR) repeat protein